MIADNVKLGKDVKIPQRDLVNLYGCEIGDNSKIGPFVEIQKGAKIGKNTTISSHSFICEKVDIGDHCFIAHGVIFINDLFKEGKPSYNPDDWKETLVEDNVSIGSNATILPVKIGKNSVIGAGAVVTRDVPPNSIVIGNPAKILRRLEK